MEKVNLYFKDGEHGVVAFRYTSCIPRAGEKITIIIGDEFKYWRVTDLSWFILKDETKVYVLMERE